MVFAHFGTRTKKSQKKKWKMSQTNGGLTAMKTAKKTKGTPHNLLWRTSQSFPFLVGNRKSSTGRSKSIISAALIRNTGQKPCIPFFTMIR